MKKKKLIKLVGKDNGFTLIEVMFAIFLLGLVLIPVLNFFQFQREISQTLINKVEFWQQIRIVNLFLQRDIKNAIDYRLEDVSGNGYQELLLNLGKLENSDKTDNYLLYKIKDNRLVIRKPFSSFIDSGISYPFWPEAEEWGYNRSLTLEIMENFRFTAEGGLIKYKFNIKYLDNTLEVSNKVKAGGY